MNPSTVSVFGSDAEAGFLERPFLDCDCSEDGAGAGAGTGTGALYEEIVLENDKFLENLPPTLDAEDSIELGASGETPSEIEGEFSGDGDDDDDSSPSLQIQTIMTATCENKNVEAFSREKEPDEEKGFLWDGEGDADYDPEVHRLEREIVSLTIQIEQGTKMIQEKWDKMDQIGRHQEEEVKGILLRKNLEKSKRRLRTQIRELLGMNHRLQTRNEHLQLEVVRLKKPIMEPPRALGRTPRPQSWEDCYFEEDLDEFQLFRLF